MPDTPTALDAERATRDAALATMTERFARLQSGLSRKGIGERLADHARGKAQAVADEALEIAEDSKGVIAGTAAVLALWLLRKPIAEQAEKWLPQLWHHLAARFTPSPANQTSPTNQASPADQETET